VCAYIYASPTIVFTEKLKAKSLKNVDLIIIFINIIYNIRDIFLQSFLLCIYTDLHIADQTRGLSQGKRITIEFRKPQKT
jgi:hypothetical protein